jgi:hypothetical protein
MQEVQQMSRLPFVATPFLILALAIPRAGDADHISARITGGTLQVMTGDAVSGTFAMTGTAGFSFSAGSDSGNSDALCQPCRSGDTISLSTVVSPPYFGTARYRGQNYAFDFENGGGQFSLNGPSFALPPGDTPEPTIVEFATPFTTGNDTRLALQPGPSELPHQLVLSGGGTATVRFLRQFDEVEQTWFYFFDSLRFEFTKEKIGGI